MTFDWAPFATTFQLAAVTTGILFLVGLPLAWWLAHSRWKFRFVAEALVAMPLVLPPSVLGFYVLILLHDHGWIGGFFKSAFDVSLAFSFTGLVIGSVLYSLPFMIQPLQAGFEQLSPSIREAAYTLGKSAWVTFRKVLLPNMRPALLTGLVLTFAHTVGEFGVVLFIGGNMESTRVASIAIYDSVNQMQYEHAHWYSLVLFAISFSVLLVVYFFNKKLRTF